MPEVLYTDVTWTAGDIATEAKMDNMVANDRAVDAMNNGVMMTERADPSTPASGKIHVYAKDKDGVSTLYAINDAGDVIELGQQSKDYVFPLTGSLVTGTSLTPILIATRALTIVKAYANVKTAPTDAAIIVDINKNGTTIWSTQANRLQVAAGATSGTETDFDVTTLAEGDILTMDIDQVGSTVAGADLTVTLKVE